MSALVALALWMVAAPADAAPDGVTPAPSAARAAHFYRPENGPPPPAQPQRIVSLAPVVTETLFLVGAGDRVVGVTRFCDRPAAATALPRVGGYTDASIERILSLRPDLVIAMPSLGQRALLDQLRAARIPVLVLFGDSLDEVRALPRAIGDAVGARALGEEVARRLDDDLAALARRPRKSTARVLLVVGVDPIVLAGAHTFADDVLRALGATPVAPLDGPPWPQWSPEAVLTARPDIVVAAEGPKARARLARLLSSSRAKVVSAEHDILMRPGPSLIADARILASLIDEASAPPPGPPSRP